MFFCFFGKNLKNYEIRFHDDHCFVVDNEEFTIID